MNQKIRLTALLLTSAFMCGQAYAVKCGAQTGDCDGGKACIKDTTSAQVYYKCVLKCGASATGTPPYSATGYCATGTCTAGTTTKVWLDSRGMGCAPLPNASDCTQSTVTHYSCK